ncbi:MAG TPA: hypothetical protein VLH75_16030 [Longimicrobiales bacterium]|nr:hypothetical protein [Longimicrobiales bacterium]
MRTLFAVLALTALVAACADQPAGPMVPESGIEIAAPSFAKVDPTSGAVTEWWRNACFVGDVEGNIHVVDCHIVATPSANDVMTLHIYADGLSNPTGKAYHFGPTNYRQSMVDLYDAVSGGLVTPVDGKMPVCDYNLATDPEQTTFICTLNWHYVISASGHGKYTMIMDPQHSWKVPCYRCWG